MSLERWRDGPQRSVRLPICGHHIQRDEFMKSEMRCLRCREVLPGSVERRVKVDCVPSTTMAWDGAECVEQRTYGPYHLSDTESVPSFEVFLWMISRHVTGTVHLCSQIISSMRLLHGVNNGDSYVWRASPLGCHVKAGKVRMAKRDILLLDGHGVHFHGTHFEGGVLVLAGTACTATLTDCTLERCELYVVHCASVTLRRCRFVDADAAAVVHGPGTTSIFTACKFSRCYNSIIIEKGATATVTACRLVDTVVAVSVSDAASRCTVVSSRLKAAASAPEFSTGLYLFEGSASLAHCLVRGFHTACRDAVPSRNPLPDRHADIQLDRCQIDGFRGVGVLLAARVRASLRQCRIVRAAVAHGDDDAAGTILANARGGSVVCMERCHVYGPRRPGAGVAKHAAAVFVGDTCRAALVMCRLHSRAVALCMARESRVHMHACWAAGGETCCLVGSKACEPLYMSRCRLIGSLHACLVGSMVTVVAVDTQMQGRRADLSLDRSEVGGVLRVTDGATAKVFRCCIRGGRNGVVAERHCEVFARDTHVMEFHESGYVYVHAKLTVVGGSVRQCHCGVKGETLEKDDSVLTASDLEPGTLSLSGVVFWSYGVGVGVAVHGECSIENCEFWAVLSAERVLRDPLGGVMGIHLLHRASRVRVVGCLFDHHRTSLVASRPSNLHILDCKFHCHLAGGLCLVLEDCASAVVQGCSFVGSGSGIQAIGSGVNVRCSSFGAGVACAIQSVGLSALLVKDCDFGGCVVGMKVERGGDVEAMSCSLVTTKQAVLLEAGGRFVARGCSMAGGSVLVEALRHFDGQLTAATLTNCQLSSAGMGVRVWGVGLAAVLRQRSIYGCDVGVYAADAVTVDLTDCTVSGCEWGVLVGLHELNAKARCASCGRKGDRAWHAARRSIATKQPSTLAGSVGLCCHQGAVTRAILQSVNIQNCKRGVCVNEFGLLDAVGLCTRKCAQGVAVVHIERSNGECSTFEECVAEACGAASSVMRVWPLGVNEETGCTEGAVPGVAVRRAGGDAAA